MEHGRGQGNVLGRRLASARVSRRAGRMLVGAVGCGAENRGFHCRVVEHEQTGRQYDARSELDAQADYELQES